LTSLDLEHTRIAVRTKAVGMLARFAHDLEIVARQIDGTLSMDGDSWTAQLTIRARDLAVAGVVRRGEVDTSVLSPSDRDDIERKLRAEVIASDRVVVELSGSSRERAQVVVRVARGEQSLTTALSVAEEGDARGLRARVELSLKRLRIREVKGPLGAFKVDDRVEVRAFVALHDD